MSPTPLADGPESGRCTWHRRRSSPHRPLRTGSGSTRWPHRRPDPIRWQLLNSVDVPAPALDAANQAMTGEVPVPPAEIPHLASPENLPPGTTMDESTLPAQSPNVGYLKELWHAIQTQDITGKDALLALTQRPLTTPAPENVNGRLRPPVGVPPLLRVRRFCRRSAPDPELPAPACIGPPA